MEHMGEIQRRRRVPRQSVTWAGKCQINDEVGGWTECEVVDISVIGVGVEVPSEGDTGRIGQTITVEVQTPAGAAVSIRLVGEIRNVVPVTERIRIGIEFVDLSETERSILDALERMRIVW